MQELNIEMNAYKDIAQICANNNVSVSKFKKFTTALDNDSHPSERGRQVTIYAIPQANVNWKELFESIARVLIAHNLAPGYSNPVCRAIPGSHYVSYRNDHDENESYISCRQVYADNDIEPENKYGMKTPSCHYLSM